MANSKAHYEVDATNRIIRAIVARLTDKELKEIKNYVTLGFQLVPVEEEKKKRATEEEKANNPFSEMNVRKFLEEKGTKAQQKKYNELYNEQATDKKTGLPAVYKNDSPANKKQGLEKGAKFKKGDKKPKGHIATLAWFKTEFPDYPDKK